VKEVKELIKQEPEYQEVLADLFFDKRINNYMLITRHEQSLLLPPSPLLEVRQSNVPAVVDVQYRIEFTVSTIARKNVMKPVVLLVFLLSNGGRKGIYFDL
jgi:hypothetical protein